MNIADVMLYGFSILSYFICTSIIGCLINSFNRPNTNLLKGFISFHAFIFSVAFICYLVGAIAVSIFTFIGGL